MLEKTITNQYNIKQKENKLKSSLNVLFIIKKMPCPLLVPCPFQILAGTLETIYYVEYNNSSLLHSCWCFLYKTWNIVCENEIHCFTMRQTPHRKVKIKKHDPCQIRSEPRCSGKVNSSTISLVFTIKLKVTININKQ